MLLITIFFNQTPQKVIGENMKKKGSQFDFNLKTINTFLTGQDIY